MTFRVQIAQGTNERKMNRIQCRISSYFTGASQKNPRNITSENVTRRADDVKIEGNSQVEGNSQADSNDVALKDKSNGKRCV